MPTPRHDRLSVRVTLLVASSLTVMAGATIMPALPAMRERFSDVPGADMWVRLVLTMPALFIVLWAPVAGVIADRFGRKRLLVASVLLYALAGGSGCVANSIPALLTGRAFLGLAVAGIMTSALALIADYLEGPGRSSFMGVQGAEMAFGGVVFLMAGGVLADIHWRAPFLVYLAAAPVIPLAALVLVEPERGQAAPPPSKGERDLSIRSLTLIYAIGGLLQVAFYVLPVQLPFLLQAQMGVGPRGVGMAMSTGALCGAVMGILYGRVQRRLSFQAIASLSLIVMAAGYGVISGATSYWQVLAGIAVSGLGFGLLMPNLNVWLTTVAPDAARGRAFGGLTTCVFSGQFLSPFVSQPLAARVGMSGTFGVVGIALVALVACYAVGRRLYGMGRPVTP